MALLTPPRLSAGTKRERVNRRGGLEQRDARTPKRSTVLALVLACLVLVVLDATTPVLNPVRSVLGTVFGPVEHAVSVVARPVTSLPHWARTQASLRHENSRLRAENANLEQRLETAPYDANKLREYEGLTSEATSIGYAIVPARVIGFSPAQGFERTVTIDAGSRAGVTRDMTVVAAQGLVGRVLSTTPTTATVLLVIDDQSVVGGRVGSSMEVGFVHGNGAFHAGLDLELVDQSVVSRHGDTVVTWGSDQGAPYISGVPIGTVDQVFSNVRDSTQRASVTPFVDFGKLDVVGVAVPSGTRSDRAVIDTDGALK